ncbi:MAG: bifunctional DNA-formamidopyrimidine glycosylase/DNA-(apurinic or apyrimidinic site) lyase [bacterium]
MPELPEVETIRRELEPALAGRRITGVELARPDIVGWPGPAVFARQATGRRIDGLDRRGKYLILRLDTGGPGRREATPSARSRGGVPSGSRTELPARAAPAVPGAGGELVIHLRLSGHLRVLPARAAPERFERARFRLSGGRALVFIEPRALGRLYLVEAGRYPAALGGMLRMGPEPVSRGFTAAFLARRLAGRKAAVKVLLLDQQTCCGVGNIYSDEALFRAGVRPDRPAGSLSPAEVRRLAAALRRVLRDGIRWCGTTLEDDRYRRPDRQAGSFQRHLHAYGRAGEPCRRPGCHVTIRAARFGNRGSCYCPGCQH